MSEKSLKIYLALLQWRDDEIREGNMEKAKRIHKVIKKRKNAVRDYLSRNARNKNGIILTD